ncbi:hypothetical protein BHU61_13190, partial [Macrococcus epidermidis]
TAPNYETQTVTIPVTVTNGTQTETVDVLVTVQRDTDDDGIPDVTDTDDDNDGIADVNDPTPKVPSILAETTTPTVTNEVIEVGGTPVITDNIGGVPAGTTVKDVTPAGAVDTSKPGTYTGVVEVTYPDGSKETVNVPVIVQDKTASDAPVIKTVDSDDTVVT